MRKNEALLLAGDIGGTNSRLALFENAWQSLQKVKEQTYPSSRYDSLEDIAADFLADVERPIVSACFGVAGPVREGRCQTTNLPWWLDAGELARRLNIGQVILLNDLEAMAYGLLALPDADFVELNPEALPGRGNRSVVAAGTGFGEAILYWDGQSHQAIATEGGHADFAPNTPEQDALLVFLRGVYSGHVSYERLLSGPGIYNIYQFLRDTERVEESPELAARIAAGDDPGRLIGRSAVQSGDRLSRETLRLFAEILGAEAGNWALKTLAYGGVMIGGGIAPKVLPLLQEPAFLQCFRDKGRFARWVGVLSVKVALNTDAGLLGAASHASRRLV